MGTGRNTKRQSRGSAGDEGEPEPASADEPAAQTKETTSQPANPKPRANRYECDYCRKDITMTVRIRCAECSEFDLCIECFSMGVELLSHKNDHPYRVIEHIAEPIFDREWGAEEERALLEGILQYGFGNWQDVAEYVGTKSKHKCQAHYNAVYLSSPTLAPLPNMETLLDSKDYKKDAAQLDRRMSLSAECQDGTTGSKFGAQSKPPPTSNSLKAQDTSLARMVGYVPKRGDFDTEYDNDAEKYLSDMEFLAEDTPEERRLKLDVIAVYNQTLDERQRRKDFILDRDLLIPCNRKRSREERDIAQKMACFARFQTKDEHNRFVQGLINEHRLRKRIEQLQEHRLLGIRTLIESVQYEAEKKKREADKNLRRDKEKLDYLYQTPRNMTSVRRRRSGIDSNGVDRRGLPVDSSMPAADQTQPEWVVDKSMPGFDSLSKVEVELCRRLRLLPKQLVSVKERIVKESFNRGILEPEKQLMRVDISKTDRVFDIFVSTGWDTNKEALDECRTNDNLPQQ